MKNIYNKYLPFYETIKQQSVEAFKEICENLSRIIQLRELRPGFQLWSSKLQQFISLYGYSFTKSDHLKLINLYLSVLSIPDLNYSNAKTCFDIIDELLKLVFSKTNFFCNIFIHSSKSRLIKRDDLIVNWQIFYVWVKLILFNNDESYSLIALPKFVIDLNKSFLILFFSVILKNHFCIVYVVVDRIFRQQQHKKFLMNFVHGYVHSIQLLVMQCAI